jgi:hypothetical protein
MPKSANQTSPVFGSVGTEGLRPGGRLLLRRENRVRAGGDVEGESLAEFDLREEHVEGVAGFHAELFEDFLGLLEAMGGDAGAEERGVCSHAQMCS